MAVSEYFTPKEKQDQGLASASYSFIARQPILDSNREIHAFELLYRDGEHNGFPVHMDSSLATRKLLAEHFLSYKAKVLESYKGFVNFSQNCLIDGVPFDFPSDSLVVEVLEQCQPDEALFQALINLKKSGYTVALDDHVFDSSWQRFYPLIDIIKIDIQQTSIPKSALMIENLKHLDITFLAEKVETNEEFERAKACGFALFQGYFFTKPEIIKSRKINASFTELMSLSEKLSADIIDFDEISQIVAKNPVLSLQLLNFINGSCKLRAPIQSVKQAVAYLGEDKLKKFVTYVLISSLAPGKPEALFLMSLHRAKMAELLVHYMRRSSLKNLAYLCGLLSLIDGILDIDMREALQYIHLDSTIKQALIYRSGTLGQLIDLFEYIEVSEWDKIDQISQSLDVNDQDIIGCNVEASMWLNELSVQPD